MFNIIEAIRGSQRVLSALDGAQALKNVKAPYTLQLTEADRLFKELATAMGFLVTHKAERALQTSINAARRLNEGAVAVRALASEGLEVEGRVDELSLKFLDLAEAMGFSAEPNDAPDAPQTKRIPATAAAGDNRPSAA